MWKKHVALLLWTACVLAHPVQAAEDLIIDRQSQWETWVYPEGTLQFGATGSVQARRIHKDINASLNAGDFAYMGHTGDAQGGIRSVGSNAADAHQILDGDPATSWAPDPDDPLETHWIELDLGRMVKAKQLRMVFAEGGPPFGEFRVFVSTGDLRFPGTRLKSLLYELELQTVARNEEHIIEHELHAEDALGRPLSGRLVQQVKVFFDKKVEGAGLAELEVISVGDNVAVGTIDRGGGATTGYVLYGGGVFRVFDGLYWSSWDHGNLGSNWLYGKEFVNGPWIKWDLGQQFWVDGMALNLHIGRTDGFRVYFSAGDESTIERHEVWQIDGRNVEWELVADTDNTVNQPKLIDFEFFYDQPFKARYVFWHQFHGGGGQTAGPRMNEVMLFGEGYLPRVTMQSPVMDTRGGYVTHIEWDGQIPPGTRVLARSRTGDDVEDVSTYYDRNGNVVTEAKYGTLPKSFKGEVITQRLPVEEAWSTWSPPYLSSGDLFVSPSPSDFVQLEVSLESSDPEQAAQLQWVALRQDDPVVRLIKGRIEPRIAQPGEPKRFTYFLQPTATFRDPGFDRILVLTPAKAEDVAVRVAGQEVDPKDVSAGNDSLVIELQRSTRRPVEVEFATQLSEDNTVFGGAVASGTGVWQRLTAEDPHMLTVRLPLFAEEPGLLHQLRVEPAVGTPNGDGINEEVVVRFVLMKLDTPRDVLVELYDLSGRRVRILHDDPGRSGMYELGWDGMDQDGKPVAPGLYLCRIAVKGDAQAESRTRVVGIAY